MTNLIHSLIVEMRIQELTNAWALFQAALRRDALEAERHGTREHPMANR
jgi:hypothetical protein